MEKFNRTTHDALLCKEARTLEFYCAARDLYHKACVVFTDSVWTQERENEMNRLEQQALQLNAVYHTACNATQKYLKDCGVL